jgi:hypothetical protein
MLSVIVSLWPLAATNPTRRQEARFLVYEKKKQYAILVDASACGCEAGTLRGMRLCRSRCTTLHITKAMPKVLTGWCEENTWVARLSVASVTVSLYTERH